MTDKYFNLPSFGELPDPPKAKRKATLPLEKPLTKSYELSTGMELLDKPDNLDDLASQIRIASSDAMRHATEATEGALIAGKLLLEAKAQVDHGAWENWLTANCQLAPRTARAYMQLAKTVPALEDSNRQRVAVLPLREALKAIATDPTAPPKPAYRSTYNPKLTDRQKTESVFGKAVSMLKATTKLVSIGLKEKQVNDLRKKLNDVLAELDRLEATAKSDGGAA